MEFFFNVILESTVEKYAVHTAKIVFQSIFTVKSVCGALHKLVSRTTTNEHVAFTVICVYETKIHYVYPQTYFEINSRLLENMIFVIGKMR